MLRASVVLLALLNLAGCLELGGGGGGGGSAPEVVPPVTPPVKPPVTPPVNPSPDEPGGTGEPPLEPPVEPPTEVPEPPEVKPEPPVVPPVNNFAEPTAAVVDELNARAFYDKDKTGAPRAVRNDLGGSLPGMVQFVQSHSVDPSGNETRNMPRLTSQKEALLLVTPDPALTNIASLQVTVLRNGAPLGVLSMRQPDEIFRSDYANNDGRPDYVYSRRAWSAVLPWDWVQAGLELRVTDNQGREGSLAAGAIDFAAAGELVVHNIRIGLLTTPPGGSHWFRSNPAEAATDYLQTIPAARITAAFYEDVTLRQVMVSSGVIYDADKGETSATTGDVYSGDMRGDTAKSTFGIGINLANWGVTTSGMSGQVQPQVTQMVTAHHARGVYTNGVVNHGLSGGNSMLTLINSSGNEFSHEIGHHYGLGHYPGQNGNDYFWAGHHHDSGWGFISYRKRMRANIHWTRAKTDHLAGMAELDDTYTFTPDAMAGGSFASSLSRYTHYTGYSTKIRIQPAFDRPVFSGDSPTGYRKWDATTRTMVDFAPAIPASPGSVWYNSASGKFLAPRRHGVPVVTLLGGYDPETNKALIYPALRGNWGNVFALPSQAVASEARACWLQVDFAGGAQQRIALAGRRMQTGLVNKLHVNLAQDEQPARAELLCQTPGQAAESLYVLAIPTNQPAMAPAVVVGKEAGYAALRAVELPALNTALEGLAGKPLLNLSGNARVLYDSWADDVQGLSAGAQQVVQQLRDQERRALRLNRWLDAYGSQLSTSEPARQALDSLLVNLQFNISPLLPAAQTLSRSTGDCVKIEQVNGVWQPYVAAKAQCTGALDERWLVDGSQRIRSAAQPSLCLTHGSNISLTSCSMQNDSQAWDLSALPAIKRGNSCMDLSGGYLTDGRGKLIGYGCTGGGNQKWYGLSLNDNLLLPLLRSRNVPAFFAYAEQRAIPAP